MSEVRKLVHEEHPLVKKLREQVKAKKDELEKENLEYVEDVILDTETTNPLIEDIRQALDGLQPKIQPGAQAGIEPGQSSDDIYKIMLIDKLDNVMGRDVRVNEQIYNMLLQRLETAKITERLQSSKEGTRYTIIDPPRLPLRPIKPNKPLVALVGMFFGGALGVGLVFLREFLDKSFLDVQDAKEYFGQPLLGAISRITTFEIMTEERQREHWILFITILIGILAITASAFIASLVN